MYTVILLVAFSLLGFFLHSLYKKHFSSICKVYKTLAVQIYPRCKVGSPRDWRGCSCDKKTVPAHWTRKNKVSVVEIDIIVTNLLSFYHHFPFLKHLAHWTLNTNWTFCGYVLSAIRLPSAILKRWGQKLSNSNSTSIKEAAQVFPEMVEPGRYLSAGYFLYSHTTTLQAKMAKKIVMTKFTICGIFFSISWLFSYFFIKASINVDLTSFSFASCFVMARLYFIISLMVGNGTLSQTLQPHKDNIWYHFYIIF